MASEAQRLIGVSLTKIAQSKTHRGGISLHKNLLVATVLQKARYIFMEEAYNIMIHYNNKPKHHHQHHQQQQQSHSQDDEIVEETVLESQQQSSSIISQENNLTYYDLDKIPNNNNNNNSLKRRRAINEDLEECEEIVQSIFSKRCKQDEDDSVFLDDTSVTSQSQPSSIAISATDMASSPPSSSSSDHQEAATADQQPSDVVNNNNNVNGNMEIDRITSLVSIFSFSMGADGRMNRSSVPTPDLCAAQAKDTGGDSLQQQRTFLAMTV